MRQEEKPSMAFIAHWVEEWNWLLWFVKKLHQKPEQRWLWIWLAPVYYLMSYIYLHGKKSFDVVDDYSFQASDGSIIEAKTVLVRNFSRHFFFPKNRNLIRQRIMDAVIFAQESGISVVGLGALTKNIGVGQDEQVLIAQLGDRLRIPVVHGDTLTAAAVLHKAVSVVESNCLAKSVFLTGATSKIGRPVALELARLGFTVKLLTQNGRRFRDIQVEAGEYGVNLIQAADLSSGADCPLWILGKSVPAGDELLSRIPQNACILNFAVPSPLSQADLNKRSDIRVYQGGLLAYDPRKTDLRFTMRLKPGVTYACHAGTFVHAYKGWQHHEVGPVEMSRMDEVWQAALEMGFSLTTN